MIPAASHLHGTPSGSLPRGVPPQNSSPAWNWLALRQCFQVVVCPSQLPILCPTYPAEAESPNPEPMAGYVTFDKSLPLSGPSFPYLPSSRLGFPEFSGLVALVV